MKKNNSLIDFLNFEKEVRLAQEQSKLNFLIANKSYNLVPFTQAVIFNKKEKIFFIEAISATSNLNPDAPYIFWLRKELLPLIANKYNIETSLITKGKLQESLDELDLEYMTNNFIYCPFQDEHGELNGGVLYFSKIDFDSNIVSIVKELQLIYSQAKQLLEKKKKPLISLISKNTIKFKYIALLLLLPIMMLPIKQTILADAQVSPMEPTLIKSSIDGVISDVLVKPNQKVLKGQVLFKLDNVELKTEVDKAKNRLKSAQENYRQAFYYSYETNASQGYISILKTEVEKEKNSLKYRKLLLNRSIIKAPLNGTIIFSSPKKWLGKPIKVGEKIMLLAIGDQKQLDINVPVKDMLDFNAGDLVLFYSNISPLTSISASIYYVSTEAQVNNNNTLNFIIAAHFNKGENPPAFGSHGTAKLYRNSVSVFYYLFRRPIIYIQSIIGF